jgi:tetratricopeptide (TPR) repeat protein
MTSKLLFLTNLLCFMLWVSVSGCNRKADNPELSARERARELNDSAMTLSHNIAMRRSPHTYTDVVSLLNQALSIDSTYQLAYTNKITVLMNAEQYGKAIHLLRKLIKKRPHETHAKIQIGIAYELRGNTAKSQQYLKRALGDYSRQIDAQPDSLNLFLDRAFVKLLLGRKKEAIKEIDSLSSAHPNSMRVKSMTEVIERTQKEDIVQNHTGP